MPISIGNFFVHVNATVVRNLVLNFVSRAVSDLWVVGIVLCVVCVTLVVVVDWVNIDGVGIVVGVVVHIMVNIDVNVVVVIDMVSCLGDNWGRVVVVRVTGDEWVNSVLLGVLMLGFVGILVMLWVSVMSVGWLSVGVLLDINNIVMMWVVWVVRVSS